MCRMSVSEARKNFSEALNKVSFGKDRIMIHRNDKDMAALVPLEDIELLEMIEDKVDQMLIEEAMKDFDPSKTVPVEDVFGPLDEE